MIWCFNTQDCQVDFFMTSILTSNPILGVFVGVGWMYSIVLVFDWYWYNRHPVTLGTEDTCNMCDTWDMYRPVSPDSQVSSHHKPRMLKQYKQVWIIYNHIWLLFCFCLPTLFLHIYFPSFTSLKLFCLPMKVSGK